VLLSTSEPLLLLLLLVLVLVLLLLASRCPSMSAAASGAIVAGKAADRWGPRHAQVVNCLAFMLGALLAGGARHYRVFLLGRFLSGIGEAEQAAAAAAGGSSTMTWQVQRQQRQMRNSQQTAVAEVCRMCLPCALACAAAARMREQLQQYGSVCASCC
jgi:MFS family permease